MDINKLPAPARDFVICHLPSNMSMLSIPPMFVFFGGPLHLYALNPIVCLHFAINWHSSKQSPMRGAILLHSLMGIEVVSWLSLTKNHPPSGHPSKGCDERFKWPVVEYQRPIMMMIHQLY